MKNRWRKVTAVILSFIIIAQSISWDGIHSIYTAYAENLNATEETGEEISQIPIIGTDNEAPIGSPLDVEGDVYEGSLNIYQDTYLTNDLVINGSLNLYSFSFQLNGHHLIINGDLRLYGEQACLKVDGILETAGGFESHDSSIIIQNGTWICQEDLILNYNRVNIHMTDAAAVLEIHKDLLVTSDFQGELDFSKGTLQLSGDYLELPGNNGAFEGRGIQAGEDLKVILNGTDSQMLDVESEDTVFMNVSVPEGETRILYLPKYNPIYEEVIEGLILYPHIYRITQEHYDYNNSRYITNYYYDNVYFEGDILNINRIVIYGNFYHKGNVIITGDTVVHGDYGVVSLQYDGDKLVYGSTEGRLSIHSSVSVDGNFITRSTSDHEMTDWVGKLTIGNSLFQYGSGVANFNPDSSFECVLNGTNPHLYFEDSIHNWMPKVNQTSSDSTILDTQVQFTNITYGVYEGRAYVRNENLAKIGSAAVMSVYMDDLVLDQNMILPQLSLHMCGQLNMNGYNLLCKDLTLEDDSNANILMEQGETLTIYNDLYVASRSNESRLSNGSIILYGNLTQRNTGVEDNFRTIDECVIQLVGSGRGQLVSFDEGSGPIQTVKIHNRNGGYVRFLTEVPVKNLLCETDTLIDQDQKIEGYQLTEDVNYPNTIILKGGILDLNGRVLTVDGDLIIEAGTLYMNQGHVIVHGDLRYQTLSEEEGITVYKTSYGNLQMEDEQDQIQVDGSVYYDTSGTKNKITNGVLETGGTLTLNTGLNMGECTIQADTIILNNTLDMGEGKLTCKDLVVNSNVNMQNQDAEIITDRLIVNSSRVSNITAGTIQVHNAILEEEDSQGLRTTKQAVVILDAGEVSEPHSIPIQVQENQTHFQSLELDTNWIYYNCNIELKKLAENITSVYEDSEAPTIPENLGTDSVSYWSVTLSYEASSDNEDQVAGYIIYRDQQEIARTKELQWTDQTVDHNTSYQYQIASYDYHGNESEKSIPLVVITPEDTIAPAAVSSLTINSYSETSIQLQWYYYANDNEKIAEYQIYRNQEKIHSITDITSIQNRYTDNTVTCGKHYTYSIQVVDQAGNVSPSADIAVVATSTPNTYVNHSSENDGGDVRIRWKDQTPEIELYKIYRLNGGGSGSYYLVDTVAANENGEYEYIDTTTEVNTGYYYRVDSYITEDQLGRTGKAKYVYAGSDTKAPIITRLEVDYEQEGYLNKNSYIYVTAEDHRKVDSIQIRYQKKGDDTWKSVGRLYPTYNQGKTSLKVWCVFDTDYLRGSYIIQATAKDPAGNITTETKELQIYATGYSAPVITNSVVRDTSITLQWRKTDTTGPDFKIRVFENGVLYTSQYTSSTTYGTVTGLKPGHTYECDVISCNYDQGIYGIPSDLIQCTTLADITPPLIHSVTPAPTYISNVLSLSIDAEDDDAIDYITIDISRDMENWELINKLMSQSNVSVPYRSYINTSAYEEGDIYIRIQAVDLVGNLSDYTIHQYVIDHTPPTRVADLTSYEVDGKVGLTWTAEEGCQYIVNRRSNQRDYRQIAVVQGGIYEDEDISYGVDYEYCVIARDLAGNAAEMSNEVTAAMMTDTVDPEITQFTAGFYQHQANIRVGAKDNAQLAGITVAVYLDQEWKNIIEYDCSGKNGYVNETYNCSSLKEGACLLKAVVRDMEGHEAQKLLSMNVDHTAPNIQDMSVTDEGNVLHIHWEPYTQEDFAYYKLIRIDEDHNERVLSNITNSITSDVNDVPEIGKRYTYQLKVVDTSGNEQILERVGRRVKADQEAPVVKITCDGEEVTKVTAGTGQLLKLSGKESTDNVGIESMKWYIDDVFVQESAHLQYYFDTKGTYRIRLEAVDHNQNQSDKTVTVKVADEITGTISENDTVLLQVVDENQTPLSYVDIYYTDDPESGEYEYTQSDPDGRVELHLEAGEYELIAYQNHYLPQEITVHASGKEPVYKVIPMRRQSITSGTVTVTDMTMQEILDAGIDLNEEENRSQVKTEIEIRYAKIEKQGEKKEETETITLYSHRPTSKTYTSSGITHQTTYQRIDTGITGMKNDPLIIIIDTQSVSWLKEMFRVDVQIVNMAGEPFNLSQCELSLNLPTGMSLVNCHEENTLQRKIGTIPAGEVKTVTWYIKGDEKGSYPISADFQAVLEPIGKLVTETFHTAKDVEVTVGEGLVLYVYPEKTARIGDQLYIQYKLVNEGDRTFYDVKTTFGEYQSAARSIKVKDRDADPDSNTEEAGHILETINFFIKDVKAAQSIPVLQGGDTVTLTALHPDEAIYGTYLTGFGNTRTEDGKKYTDIGALYEIVKNKAKILEGYNTGLRVEIVPIKAHKTFVWYYGDHTYDLPDPRQHTTPPDPIPEPVVTPVPKPHFFQGDPVSLSTGAYQAEINAITLQGIEPLAFKMSYDSMYTSEHGELGYGWNHNYEWKLEAHGNVLELYQNPYQSLTFIRENAVNGIVYGSIQDNDIMVESVEGDVKYVCLDASASEVVLLACEAGGYTLTQADGTVYEFDAEGSLIRTISRHGNIVDISRGEHSMKLTEQGSGCYILLQYDDTGLLTDVSDSSGRGIHLAYDDQKELITYTDVNGSSFGFTYDENHRILTGIDPEGQTYLVNTFDEEGRVLTQDDGDSKTDLLRFEYSTTDDGYLLIKSKDRNGKYLSTKSDNSSNIISQVNELGDTIAYTYDAAGRLLSKTAAGLTESYTYSDEGYLTAFTDKLGNQTIYQYDDCGNCIAITDIAGTHSYQYDTYNRLILATNPHGITTTYTYNDYGLLTEEKVEGKGKTSYTYNGYQLTEIKDVLGHTTETVYDAAGRLTDVTDALGNLTHTTYDARGAVTGLSQTDAATGKMTQCSYSYDSVGNLISYTDGNGYTTTYEYDINDQLIAENYPDGTRTECVRDGEGNILSITYSDTIQGSSMEEAVYDAAGNLTELKNVYGYTTTYQYGSLGRLESVLQPNGGKITYTYDGHGLLTGQTDARGNTTTFAYDSAGRLIGITDTLGVICRVEYDSYGQIISIEDGTGSRTTLTYDVYGQVIRSEDAAGNLTTYEYDIAGNRIRQTNALGAVTEYEYDSAGQVVTVRKLGQKKDKLETNYTYDAFGNIISITDGEGNTYQISYDKNGNPVEYYDAYGRLMQTMRYDCRNQLVETVRADGQVQTSTYDAMGNLLSSVTRNSSGTASVLYQYGSNGMLSQVTDQAGNTSSITYDEMGNIVDYTNPNGGVTSYTYDKNNNILREQVGDDYHLTYTYDERNQRIRKENARGQRTVYEYDLAGRLVSQKDALGTITYTYDKQGNLTEVTDATGTIRREYDAIGQMTAYKDTEGNRLTYDYDLYGNVVKLHYADGRTVSYGYDKNGHVTTVTDWAGRITNYTYNKNGQLTETKRADGSLEIRTYNDAGQLLSISDTVNGSMIHQYTYQYDGNGNITHIRTEGEEAAAGDLSLIPECVMEYDSVNRLTKYNGETVRYDADGNMTYGPLNGVMTKFTYDCRNRLIQAGDTTYIYDAENNRIGMETPKKQVRYVVDSQQELTRILQANETDTKTHEQKVTYYTYGRGLIAQEQITVEGGFQSTVEEHTGLFGRTKYKTGIYRIYHFDHLGSTTAVTNEEGTVVNSYDYSPYGQIIAGKEDVYLFLYNGQYGVTTDGNGLYHMRARYYNVSIMRFINQDVVHGNLSDSQSLNRFAYVEGNPINFLDPFGLNKTDNSEVYENLHLLIRGIQLTVMLIGLCTELGMVPSLIIAAILGAIDWILYFIEYGEDGVYTPDEQKELVFYGLIFVLGLIATYYTVDILLVCFPDFIDWLKNVITEEMEENEKERAIPYDKDTDSEYIIIPNEL